MWTYFFPYGTTLFIVCFVAPISKLFSSSRFDLFQRYLLNFTPLNQKGPLYGEKRKIVEKLIFIVPMKRPDGQIQHRSLPTNELLIGYSKKGRTHIVISCPKKTKSFEENLLLTFQSSNFKMDYNSNIIFGLFLEPQPQKSVQILLHNLTPVNNTEILAPQLEGDQRVSCLYFGQ